MGVVGDNGRFGGHPRVKQPVGARLASLALRIIYNRSTAAELVAPVVSVASLSGTILTIHFTGVDAQLGLRFLNTTMCSLFPIMPPGGTGKPAGVCCAASPFEVSGDGHHWRRTSMPKVVKNTLSIPYIQGDRFVRYAWTDTPMCMLYLGACEGCGPDPPSGRVSPPLVPFNISISAKTDDAAAASVLRQPLRKKTLPNFVMVLTDDLGWNTAWHNKDAISPTLDAMVKDSAEMMRHYVYRYCAPTRGSFLTGRYPMRLSATRANLIPWT